MTRLANINKWAPIISLLWLGGASCTKLDVKTYSSIPSSLFWKTPAEIAAGKAPAYVQLENIAGHSTNSDNTSNQMEITSDEMIVPTRGTDWYDGGQWARFYYHQAQPSDVDNNLAGTWNDLFNGASNCNFISYTLQNLPAGTDVTLQADVAEVAALRSFYYYKAMDLFGNIPYTSNFKVDPSTVTNLPRAAVYDSLVASLQAALPYLSTTVGGAQYGKVNKYFAFMLLARLYLNAQVYTGTPDYANTIAMCDSVINSGNFVLEPNYFEPFYGVNNQSKENIFVIPFANNGLIAGNGIIQASIEFNSALTFGIPCCGFGNNGPSTTHDFYQYFDTTSTYAARSVSINGRTVNETVRTFNDARTGQYLIGQQFQGDGVTNWPPNVNWVVASSDYCCTYNGDTSVNNTNKIGDYYNGLYSQVIYYDTMTYFTGQSTDTHFRHAGLKNIKYWPQPGASNGAMGNAFAVYRLADAYLMRGEAEFRNGDLADALVDFNTVRARAYGSHAHDWTLVDLTLPNILAERGKELAWEESRRTDQVRFGTYTAARNYPPKPADASDNHTIILPISAQTLSTNANLKQNPGY